MNKYCTYFSFEFLPFGLTLLDSISEHDPGSTVFVLCLDSKTIEYLEGSNYSKVNIIELRSLEEMIPELLRAKANRSRTEYFWTLTPCIIYYILFIKKNCSCITYLDADQIFYSSPTPIFNERNKADITIMPHRFPAKISHLENHGKYNVSWLTFNKTENSRMCLDWWMNSCLDWCYSKGESDRYGDQKYLDQFEKKFKNIHVVRNQGCGLAPWNFTEFNYSKKIILLHYQSLRRLTNFFYSISIPLFENLNISRLKPYFATLIIQLRRNNQRIQILESDKSCNFNDDSLIIFQIFNNPYFISNHHLIRLIFSLNNLYLRLTVK